MTLTTATYDDAEWQLVPREMSPQHLIRLANSEKGLAVLEKPKFYRDAYKAMLSAAPRPSPIEGEGKPEGGNGWRTIDTADREKQAIGAIWTGTMFGMPFEIEFNEETGRWESLRWTEGKPHIPTHWFNFPEPSQPPSKDESHE